MGLLGDTNEQTAWLDGLSDDDWMIVNTPRGYLAELIIISPLKTALNTDGMTVADRMELLEALNSFAGQYLTAEAVAAVQSACDTAIGMIHEAMTLPMNETWRLIGGFDMFSVFAKLNPSLVAAIRLCNLNLSPRKRAA